MKTRKAGIALAAFVFVLIAATICFAGGGKEGGAKPGKMEEVTITVQMFSGPEFDAMVPTADYWNENYAEETGITVNAIAGSRVGYFEKMQSQLVAGLAEPDIVHPFNMFIGKLQPYLEPTLAIVMISG